MTRRYTGGFLSAKEQATDANTANGIYTLQEAAVATASGNFPIGRWTPQRSLRFSASRSQYLVRKPSSATNRKTWTWSCWFKPGIIDTGNYRVFIEAFTGANDTYTSVAYSNNQIWVNQDNGSGGMMSVGTNAVYRDPAAWYHLVAVVDTTQSVSTNRVKIYINGVQQVTTYSTTPSQNLDTWINSLNSHRIGGRWSLNSGGFFDGYMAEPYLIDGQALTPSYFGMTDPETGTWVPKRFGTPIYQMYSASTSMISYTGFGGFNTSNLVDGSNTTGTAFYADAAGVGSYIQWDLGAGNAKAFRKISLAIYKSSGTGLKMSAVAQYSDDGSSWTTCSTTIDADAEGAPYGSGEIFQIGAKWDSVGSHRYWRIYKTNSAAGGDYCNGVDWYEQTSDNTSVAYGENGFYLDFSDNSSTSVNWAAGADRSGNENSFRTYSHTAGIDIPVDVPGIATVSARADVGGIQRGNYCTWNPLQKGSNPYVTLSDGNLKVVGNTSTNSGVTFGTMSVTSGKWYWEITATVVSSDVIGIATRPLSAIADSNYNNTESYTSNWGYGQRYNGSVYGISGELLQGSGFTYTTNDVIGVAVDADNGAMYFSKNGVWQFSGNPLSGSQKTGAFASWDAGENRPVTPFQGGYNTGTTVANFGQNPFSYAPPAGYKTLNTTNLPNPVIKRPNDHFDVKTYTGNGTNLSVGNTVKQTSGMNIAKSVKFDKVVNNYLSRMPHTAGNQQKFTWSGWIKRTALTDGYFFVGGQTSTNRFQMDFYQNRVEVSWNNGSWVVDLTTAAGISALNDTTKWHHYVIAVDTTQITAISRVRLYIDNVYVPFTNTTTFPSQNSSTPVNSLTEHCIARSAGATGFIDAQIADVNFVDGQQLTASSFGAYDASNNWVPQRYAGTYGTNGFYLPMSGAPEINNTSYSMVFNGSSGKFSTPSSANLAMGSGDFTIEMWCNQASLPQPYPRLFQFGAGWNTNQNWALDPGHSDFGADRFVVHSYVYGGNATPLLVGKTKIKYGVWYHVAVSRSGSTWRLFVNGKLDASNTWSGSVDNGTSNYMIFGGSDSGYEGTAWYNGQLANIRVVKGSALYTTNFTPPTTDLTAVSGTQLLVNGSTVADSSSNAFSLTSSTPAPKFAYPYATTYPSTYFSGTTAYLSGTLPSAIGTGDFTVEMWARPTALENYDTIFSTTRGTTGFNIGWGSDGLLTFYTNSARQVTSGSVRVGLDVWNHIAYVRSGSTITIYVNGKSVASGTSQTWNLTATAFSIGSLDSGSEYFNGYLRDVRVTKQALYTGNFTPSTSPLTTTSQGATSANVILLACQDAVVVENSQYNVTLTRSNTQASIDHYPAYSDTVGIDYSGNANHFGMSAVSLGVDSTYSVLRDSPTDADVSGVLNGNYAILNPNDKGSVVTISAGGLSWAQSTTTAQAIRATLPMPTGKWYWELSAVSNNSPGILKQSGSISTYVGGDSKGWSYFVDGTLYNNNGNASFGATHNGSDVISVAFDADTGKLWFAKNGVWQASGNPTTGANPAATVPLDPNDLYYPAMSTSVTGAVVGTVNFGQRPFAFTPPTGFRSLNTKNLKELGSYNLPDSFGNFVNTPDMVWIKSYSNTTNHTINDTVRGPKNYVLPNLTNGMGTDGSVLTFNPNGFNLGTDAGVSFNYPGYSYVSWNWNRGAIPGFDIVQYSGDSDNNRMIPHNLGQVPAFYITKNLSGYNNSNGYNDWSAYHKNSAAYNAGRTALYLHSTTTAGAAGGFFNNPSSVAFAPNQTLYDNVSGNSYIAYLWAEVPGFSKFGSYVGNSSSDGTFIYTGFRPRWIMCKSTSGVTGDWFIYDTARLDYNGKTVVLYANYNGGNGTTYDAIDILSNGFKMRTGNSSNNSSGTYVYAAFAEAPFKYANAR